MADRNFYASRPVLKLHFVLPREVGPRPEDPCHEALCSLNGSPAFPSTFALSPYT